MLIQKCCFKETSGLDKLWKTKLCHQMQASLRQDISLLSITQNSNADQKEKKSDL